MANVEWIMRLYDLEGDPITAADYSGAVSNQIKHATGRKLTLPLNGLDQLEFTLYLDDPMALQIVPLKTIVKLWRNVNDVENSLTWTQPATEPTFAGVVQGTRKQGEQNTMNVAVMSPLWRLQFHFHLLNHYLVNDFQITDVTDGAVGGNEDDLPWDQSALMWRLIDLINGAWPNQGSHTRIYRPTGTSPFWTKTVEEAPFPVAKGSYTWQLVMEELLQQEGGVDLVPEYFHTDGDPKLMYFDTAVRRGSDITATTSFDYHTGSHNCIDMSDDEEIIPGKFANYVWAVPQGGPNKVIRVAEDIVGSYGRQEVGVYMKKIEKNVQSASAFGSANDPLQVGADSELALSKLPQRAIIATLSPVTETGFYYKTNYDLGDLVEINAAKGALSITGREQRVYIIELEMTDANTEIAKVTNSEDFATKYP
jgi:hypothetical protein